MKKYLCIILSVVFVALISSLITRHLYIKNHPAPPPHVVYDTLFLDSPVPDTAYVTKYVSVPVDKYIPVSDTVLSEVHDTTFITLPITTKRYHGEYPDYSYKAWVSGFDPSLDSLQVVAQTKYVTTTEYRRPEIDASPFLLLHADGIYSATVGMELNLTTGSVTITPRVGYTISNSPYKGWSVDLQLKYNLFYK